MIGALWTGISGLSSQQQALDSESNNIANVNTIGYKSSRISFADQMYQDRIGKGSKILDAEKLYTQGNLKLTGVDYDMALSGEGFFTVANTRSTGTTENFYTRAGNFRMGDNGTLQDSAGNEVQGWMMRPIDTQKDVLSTNPNVDVFTNDYTKMLSSKVIKHSNYVETITAKATDYTQTAKSDSETIFDGYGLKSKSSKISDIESAIKDYATWLQRLSEEPDGASATSIAQTTHINFQTEKNDALIRKEGDQVYAFVNGTKYSQNYIQASADQQFKENLWNNSDPAFRTDYGLTTDPSAAAPSDAENDTYDLLASRVETYKGLANKLSEIPGLVAHMSKETGGLNDVLEVNDSFEPNTNDVAEMVKGIIQIKSLIPGEEFTVSEVGEVSGNTTVQGNYLTQTQAQAGQGIGALESSRDALSKLITGKQRDVYTTNDLNLGKSPIFNYNITIYDKELEKSIPVPNDGATPPKGVPVFIDTSGTDPQGAIDKFVEAINNSEDANGNPLVPAIGDYIEAKNVNGNLVIETKDENYDVEFTGILKQLPSFKVDLNEVVDNSDYDINFAVDGSSLLDLSPSAYGGTTLSANDIYTQVETELNTNFPNATYPEINITPLSNGSFTIYSTDEDTSFSGSNISIGGENILPTSSGTAGATTSTTLEVVDVDIGTASAGEYRIEAMGETISYTASGTDTVTDIYNGLNAQLGSSSLSGLISFGALSGTSFDINQDALEDLNTVPPKALSDTLSLTSFASGPSIKTAFVSGQEEVDIDFTQNDNQSVQMYELDLNGTTLTYKTTQEPGSNDSYSDIATAFDTMLPPSSEVASITDTAGGIKLNLKPDNTSGYDGSVTATNYSIKGVSITGNNDPYETIEATISETTPLDKNNDYSGRMGAGAEFIELKNIVDQTATKGSLQLRLDTLGISDSAFGEFSVDSTGLIMMKQDGADFAIGQASIALFNNNRGLNPVGDNLLAKTNQSGEPIYNLNNDKTAKVEGQTLELSTADLSESLVNLMVFQRAFEANAKSITTSDQLLNTLINLKR